MYRSCAWLVSGIALAVGVAACGGGDDDSTPTGTAGSPQSISVDEAWKGTYDTGSEVSVDLFVPASDPALAKFEELRKAANAPAVVYGRVTAKNTGSREDTGRFLTLTDSKGDQFSADAITMDFACALAYRWSQTPRLSPEGINAYTSLYNIDCRGATIAGAPFQPGETLTFFVAVESASEPEFERVFSGAGRELKR